MDYTNFEVGGTFPLPIQARGDGGLFQVDGNGAMFILQLSRTDVIAHEAFRTGEMELALFVEDGVLFFLYKIDGIFRSGWGDAPLAVHLLAPEHLPTEKSLAEEALHLYFVDPRLNVLLAQRQIPAEKEFWRVLSDYVKNQLAAPPDERDFNRRVGELYRKYSPDDMRERAAAHIIVPSALNGPLH